MSRLDDTAFYACATDRQWWNETKHCGGCGDDTCHPDTPCTSGEDGCRYCPSRTLPHERISPPPPKHQEVDGQLDILKMVGEA